MGGLSDAVKNGPAIRSAETARVQARIDLAEQRAKTASSQASEYRRKAGKNGPLAWYWRQAAEGMDTVAAQRRHEAGRLRTKLAKAKADEAAKEARHVKRTVASTAAEGLTPKVPGQVGPAKPSQDKRGGQPVAKPRKNPPREVTPHPKVRPETHGVLCPCCGGHHGADYKPAKGKHCGWCHGHGRGGGANFVLVPSKAPSDPQSKGTPAMTVSGEAVNVEQTRAVIDQLRSQVTDTRGAFEGASGSLASGGLGKLAGSLSSADDALDSVLSSLDEADRYLSDQEAIAEAAQAAGEMHADTSFYG